MAYHQLINQETMSEFVDMQPGVIVSRSISDGQLGELGGGHVTWVEDTAMHGVLGYDEIIYVIEGSVDMETQDGPFTAGPGDSFVLAEGADAHYFAKAGTKVFYVVHPR